MSHFVYSFLAFPAKHALSLQTFNIFSISALPQKTSEGYPLPFTLINYITQRLIKALSQLEQSNERKL